MAVFVDSLMNHGWVLRGKNVESCHLCADSLEELDEFAVNIGMKTSWRHKDHYDLVASKRALAIARGAIDCGVRENFQKYWMPWFAARMDRLCKLGLVPRR